MSNKEYLQKFSDSYEATQPDFAEAIRKWTPLIESTAYKITNLVGRDEEDVLQDILLDLAGVAEYHKEPLYRYKGKVWSLERTTGKLAKLVSPKMNVTKLMPVWIYKSRLVRVKKSSASSLVYRRLTQCVPDAANKHFTQRNGFQKTKTKRVVVEKSGQQRKSKVKEIWIPKQQHKRVLFEDILDLKAKGYSPEENCVVKNALQHTSKITQQIANIFLTEGVISNHALSRRLSCSVYKASCGRVELYRRWNHTKCPIGCDPVFLKADYVK